MIAGLAARARAFVDRWAATPVVDPPSAHGRIDCMHGGRLGRLVVSDIDDTVKPSVDPLFRGAVYPGVRTLYAALSAPGDIHFVTARDGVFVRAEHALAGIGIDVGSIRYGNTFALLLAATGNHSAIQQEKVKDILSLAKEHPDQKMVLVGDTVQADASVFRTVLSEDPDSIEVVLLHAVRGFSAPDDMKNHPQVIVFTDYADAAQQLFARGTLSAAQRDDVLRECAAAAP
jgi:phosphatidate phosphatase APP1